MSALHVAFTVRSLFATDIPRLCVPGLGEIRGVSSGRAYKSRDYRREICPLAELNTTVSRVANRGAKSRSSRRRPPHDTRICQLDGNFPPGTRSYFKIFPCTAQKKKRRTGNARADRLGRAK